MTGIQRAQWLCGVLLVVAGCPSDGSGPAAVGPVPEAEAPATAVDVICGAFDGCDCPPAAMAPDGCPVSIDEQMRQAQGDAIAAGLEYDADCMGRLLSSVRAVECKDLSDFTITDLVELAAEYQCKVFYGTDGPGQACEVLVDLGDSCVPTATCIDALCVAIPEPVAEGGDCDPSIDFITACETGTFCIDVDGDGQSRCLAIPERGDPCLGSQQVCNIGLACTDGTCVVAPGNGEACHLTGGFPCAEDLQCNFTTSVCEPLPQGGETCDGSCAKGFECTDARCVALEPLVCGIEIYGG